MFTGIVQKIGKVLQAEDAPGGAEAAGVGRRLLLETGFAKLDAGESIAVNGVCLTVAEGSCLEAGRAAFFLSPETLARTNLATCIPGRRVNLERALAAGERLSGHIVQGHVDGLGRVARLARDGETRLLSVSLPPALSKYCVEKGSLALDGTSLTVNRIIQQAGRDRVEITLIPHTWAHTRFDELAEGDELNVEVDVLAKYVERLCQPHLFQIHSKQP